MGIVEQVGSDVTNLQPGDRVVVPFTRRIPPARTPRRRWFGHYQELFDTVELNTTCYRLPTANTVEDGEHPRHLGGRGGHAIAPTAPGGASTVD
ncbi:hypothetical protein BH24ACT5_BH24ACT5_21500 [soil metagenome]